MAIITQRRPNTKPVMSPEQIAQIDQVCILLDNIFAGSDITPVVVIANNENEADVVSRIQCGHCIWKLFTALSEQWLLNCIEDGLVEVLGAPSPKHKVH